MLSERVAIAGLYTSGRCLGRRGPRISSAFYRLVLFGGTNAAGRLRDRRRRPVWTGKILTKFMSEDKSLPLVSRLRRTAVFQKVAELNITEGWVHQRFVARRSPKPVATAVSDGLWLLRKGALREFVARVRERLS
jgi:hypothetical protein